MDSPLTTAWNCFRNWFLLPIPRTMDPRIHARTLPLYMRKLGLIALNRYAAPPGQPQYWRERLESTVDARVVSYPKCGRTWLTLMLARAYQHKAPWIPEPKLAQLEDLWMYHSDIPHIQRTHDRYRSLLDQEPEEALSRRRENVLDKPVLLLLRHPLDVLVSRYYQERHRVENFRGNLEEFATETDELPRIIRFYNLWGRLNQDESITLVYYEQLQQDAPHHLNRLLKALPGPRPDRDAIREAVQYAHFDNMRSKEQQGFFPTDKLQPADPDRSESYKTRRGEVGGYRDELPDEIVRSLKSKVKEELNYFFDSTDGSLGPTAQ